MTSPDEKETPIQPPLRLVAESIITFSEEVGVLTIALFKPDEATMEMVKNLERGARFSGSELVDLWDDGEESVHTSQRGLTFVTYNPQAGHKQHTQILKFNTFGIF